MCSPKIIKRGAILFFLPALLILGRLLPDFFQIFHLAAHNLLRTQLPDIYTFDIEPHSRVLGLYLSFILLLLSLIFFFFSGPTAWLCRQWRDLWKNYLATLKEIVVRYRFYFIFFVSVNLLIRLWLMIKMPVFVDEAWTYFGFSTKGFLTSVSYYPAPNNHILHSILTNFSTSLPFDSLTGLRLPALAVNLLLIITFWVVFVRLTGHSAALVITALFAFSFPVLYYGYISRGYSLYMLAFLLLFYASLRLLKNENPPGKYYVLWAGAAVFGFYSIPSFLYPFVTTFLFLILYFVSHKRKRIIKKFVLANFLAGLTVILLYLPVFLVSGYRFLIDNPYVHMLSRRSVWYNLDDNLALTSRFLFNMPAVFSLIIFGFLLFYLRKKLLSPEVAYAVFLILFPPVLMLLHGSIPMVRLWVYELIPVYFLLAYVLRDLFYARINIRRLTLLSVLLAVLQTAGFLMKINTYESDSFLARKIFLYLQDKGADNLFTGRDTYLGTSVLFHFDSRQLPLRYVEAVPLNDSLYGKYDYFLLRYPPEKDFVKNHSLFPVKFAYKNSERYLYLKNKP